MTNTIHTLAAALAIAALAAPAAEARTPDQHPSAWAGQKQHELRSRHDRDVARYSRGTGKPTARTLPGPPTWPAHPQVIAPPHVVEEADGSGIDWTPIALGIGAGLLAMAGLGALSSHRTRRVRHPRVSA